MMIKTEAGLYCPVVLRVRGGPSWTPANLFTGADGAFYDISDLSTLFQDSAGTTPVTLDGDPVGKVLDKSGLGNHLTQSTAAARPVYKTDGTYHWLLFDTVDDYLTTAADRTLTLPHFLAFSGRKDAGGGLGLFSAGANTLNAHAFVNIASAGRISGYERFGGGSVGQPVSAVSVPGDLVNFVASSLSNGTNIDLHVNNLTYSAASGWTSGSIASARFGVSDYNLAGRTQLSRFYGGVVINASPSAEDRDSLKQWLADKAGVTL